MRESLAHWEERENEASNSAYEIVTALATLGITIPTDAEIDAALGPNPLDQRRDSPSRYPFEMLGGITAVHQFNNLSSADVHVLVAEDHTHDHHRMADDGGSHHDEDRHIDAQLPPDEAASVRADLDAASRQANSLAWMAAWRPGAPLSVAALSASGEITLELTATEAAELERFARSYAADDQEDYGDVNATPTPDDEAAFAAAFDEHASRLAALRSPFGEPITAERLRAIAAQMRQMVAEGERILAAAGVTEDTEPAPTLALHGGALYDAICTALGCGTNGEWWHKDTCPRAGLPIPGAGATRDALLGRDPAARRWQDPADWQAHNEHAWPLLAETDDHRARRESRNRINQDRASLPLPPSEHKPQ